MTKVLVAFGSDLKAGDSSFSPESCGKYEEGMTFEQAHEMWALSVMADWGFAAERLSIKEFLAEEFCDDAVGFWVIDEKMHKIIVDVDVDFGNDSALYAGIRTMKSQIEAGSDFVLER